MDFSDDKPTTRVRRCLASERMVVLHYQRMPTFLVMNCHLHIAVFLHRDTYDRVLLIIQLWKHPTHGIQLQLPGVTRHSSPRPLEWIKSLFPVESVHLATSFADAE